MAVITIILTESDIQIISGIPRSIFIETSIPATVFYTLDGTDPDFSSSVYLGGDLYLPTGGGFVLKLLATDGVDSSGIIDYTYGPDISVVRRFGETVTNLSQINNAANWIPFGDYNVNIPVIYGNVEQGVVSDSDITDKYQDGYDADGNLAPGGTDQPLDTYTLIYSEANANGERGRGIGTLPSTITIQPKPPEYSGTSSNINDRFFNPKAGIIYMDSRDPPKDLNTVHLNRMSFSLENHAVVKDGGTINTIPLETPVLSGNFLRAFYNHKEGIITYYYLDSQTLRWIISKEPWTPPDTPGLYNMVYGREQSHAFVFKWVPFKGSRLI